MVDTSLSEWYLWRKYAAAIYPWNRRYLNTDFLRVEKKQIEKMREWQAEFKNTSYGDRLNELVCYVLPSEIKPYWLNFQGGNDYVCKVLSALRNTPMFQMVAFFPKNKIPQDYALIRITSSRKHAIFNTYTKSTRGLPSVIVESWELLPNNYLYLDIQPIPKLITEIFEKGLGAEKTLAEALQTPLVSAPYVFKDIGGISLSTLLDPTQHAKSAFEYAKELCKTMQLMLPPEYRGLLPPKSIHVGKKIIVDTGVTFHVAERFLVDKNYFSSVLGDNFKVVDMEMKKRNVFPGEYSILGSLIPSGSMGKQLLKEMIHKFFDTELCVPNMSNLLYTDIPIPRLAKLIDENLWLQIVNMRQLTPFLNISSQEIGVFREKIKKDIDVILTEKIPSKYAGEIFINMKADSCMKNLGRVAQSFARTEGKEKTDSHHLALARSVFIDRFNELAADKRLEGIVCSVEDEKKKMRGYVGEQIIRCLKNPTTEEIYQYGKVYVPDFGWLFKDMSDLQGLLDWYYRKAYVICGLDKRYVWV